MKRLFESVARWPLIALLAAAATGALVGVPVAAKLDSHFSSNAFCATNCHVMEGTVYQELKQSTHGTSAKGVHPTCAQCHISRSLPVAMWEHTLGLSDLYAYVVRGIRTPQDFEKVRAVGAERVRMDMLANDSDGCRGCHVMQDIRPEKKRGQRQHAEAQEKGTTCIACHYNIVHKEVEPTAEFLRRAGLKD